MRQMNSANISRPSSRASFVHLREPGAKFYALLDAALAEIRRREPSYLSRFPPVAPSISLMAAEYARHPLCAGYDTAIIERALAEGLRYFAGVERLHRPSGGRPDLVTRFLCDSIIDAFCADRGGLALEPVAQGGRSAPQILADDYDERRTQAGQRYFVRRSGATPLLLVNGLGVPVDIWWRLLGDSDHDFKVIVAESPCGDMFTGGMTDDIDIAQEADGLAAVLRAESLGPAAVLGWCSSAKIAIDLAGRHGDQVSSLVLLAPSLTGMPGLPADLSPFEKDFRWLTEALRKSPSLAPSLAKALVEPKSVIWDAEAEKRAATLLELPAEERRTALTIPMSEPESLMTLMRRFAADDRHPTGQILSRLDIPILAVLGRHDRVIQPAYAALALATAAPSARQVTLSGSGHYIHDLQYHYFRLLLAEFVGHGRAAPPSARMSVA